jgi:hypothetical protein
MYPQTCSGSAQACSPSAQIKAVAAHAYVTKMELAGEKNDGDCVYGGVFMQFLYILIYDLPCAQCISLYHICITD